VSLRSGGAVAKALEERGHKVAKVDILTETGRELDGVRCDVAFIALHGRFGEDGGIQKILESRGIPYTGSGPAASRAAMDKLEAKRRFIARGVETPPHLLVANADSAEQMERRARSLGYPVVLKPRAEGSSVGVTVHRDKSTLAAGAAEAVKFGSPALMEKFVADREMTVGVLADRALPIIEIRPAEGFFDYSAKYKDQRTEYIVGAPLDEQDARKIQGAALAAHRALGCEGASRVDVIFTPLHAAYVLEVNTIPGMTERSLLPKAARAAGIEYGELCERIALDALRRRRASKWVASL
jgi:D-alanine-D-alanine ligase